MDVPASPGESGTPVGGMGLAAEMMLRGPIVPLSTTERSRKFRAEFSTAFPLGEHSSSRRRENALPIVLTILVGRLGLHDEGFMVTDSDRAGLLTQSAIARFLPSIALTGDQKEVIRVLLSGAATLAVLFVLWVSLR